MKLNKKSGFTLIEVMITISIIGILAAVAWPFYESQSAKNRRGDAIRTLTRLQSIVERCYNSSKGTYGPGTYEGCTVPATTPKGYYTLNLSITLDALMPANKQGVGYTLTATRATGGAQDISVEDRCHIFSLNNLGERDAKNSGATSNPSCWGD